MCKVLLLHDTVAHDPETNCILLGVFAMNIFSMLFDVFSSVNTVAASLDLLQHCCASRFECTTVLYRLCATLSCPLPRLVWVAKGFPTHSVAGYGYWVQIPIQMCPNPSAPERLLTIAIPLVAGAIELFSQLLAVAAICPRTLYLWQWSSESCSPAGISSNPPTTCRLQSPNLPLTKPTPSKPPINI